MFFSTEYLQEETPPGCSQDGLSQHASAARGRSPLAHIAC